MLSLRSLWVSALILLSFTTRSAAQVNCPSNINFELGTLTNWSCYTSSNTGSGTYSWSLTSPINNRHKIVSGTATDPYGGFPIVAPGGGTYSLKLGNDGTGKQMEQVRYTFTVPTGQNEFAVIYRYAVVLENPGHPPIEQPFFRVRAYNATTNATVNCGSFDYVSSSSLPGFVYAGSGVYYKDWATASLNLSGQAGNTITLEFTTSDCSQSAHFGYAYVDMNCGLFAIQNTACNSSAIAPLSAPPGFQSYTWYDSSFSQVVGTGQSITVPNPTQRTLYRVELVPYPGYGCTDTLSSAVVPAILNVNAGKDTALCTIPSVQLSPVVTGNAPPFNYSWTANTGASSMSCVNCSTPTVTPTTLTDYYLTITDANNCTARDTVSVLPTVSVVPTITPVSCFGGNNGSITVTVQNGTPPLAYQWTTPTAQNATVISGLSTGSYSITVTDDKGCVTQPAAFVVPQPNVLTAAISASQNVSCKGGNTGSATVIAGGGTAPYSYSWNTTPAQTSPTASNLSIGSYTVTVTDAKGCVQTAVVTITEPAAALSATATQTASFCSGVDNGTATVTATGGTSPYSYSWNTVPAQTTASISGLSAGTYTVTVTDSNNCLSSVSVTVIQIAALTLSTAQTDVSCNGGNNGTTTVTASGGTSPYSYSWNTIPAQTTPTASNLISGNYTVTVTDSNGCSSSQAVVITEPSALQLAATKTDVPCNGGNSGRATVTASGGTSPYAYSWNTTPAQTTDTAGNLIAGNYIALVTDAKGCTDTLSAIINEPAVLLLTSSKTDISCNGRTDGTATVIATGGTAPYAYSWNTTPTQTTATAGNLSLGSYTATVTDVNGCIQSLAVVITEPAALTATTVQTNVSCNGGNNGTAAVTATGGTTPYAYSWNTTPIQTTDAASGLFSGTYTVTVTDANGCLQTATATVAEPSALTATTTQTDVSCNGGNNGAAVVTINGGTSPYAYSWNTTPTQTTASVSGLISGSYTATVTDANGCTQTATATVTEPVVLAATVSKTDVSCNGGNNGTATVIATGGTTPYTYSWNTPPAQTTASISGLSTGSYAATVTDANGCMQTTSVTVSQPMVLTATTAKTDVSCNGGNTGTATVTASGGTLPYSYAWNTTPAQATATANNLTSGSYTVTVTDAGGCTQTATTTLSQPTVLTGATTKTNVSCNGGNNGTATVTASGGTAPYAYSWNTTPVQTTTTVANLTASLYTVTITDAKNCIQTVSATIIQPPPFSATPSQTNISCNGGTNGTATVVATGGTPPYAYAWNTTPVQTTTSLSGLAVGSYTVAVTDANGCTQMATISITQPAALTTTISKTDASCYNSADGTATVTVGGGTAPYSYSWNTTPAQATPTATTLPPGNYTVTVTDANGCMQTATMAVGSPSAIALSVSPTNALCAGGNTGTATVTATGGTAPYAYSWNTTPVKTTAAINNLVAGSYTVTVTDSKGCMQTAIAVISEPLPLTANGSQTNVSCNGGNNATAAVTASGGTTPYSYSWNTIPAQITASISGLSAGTYTATVTDANGCLQTSTVTVMQPSGLLATATGTNPKCYGDANGTVTAIPNGGTAPYTYSWNTTPTQTSATATALPAGTYTATVLDVNGCTATTTASLTSPDSLSLSMTARDVRCFNGIDGMAAVSVTGGTTPYLYEWNGNAALNTASYNSFSAGTQVVRITDANGCVKTGNAVINSPTPVVASLVVDSIPCFGGSTGVIRITNVTGGAGPYEYYWQGSTSVGPSVLQNLRAGSYTVRIIDQPGCTNDFTVTLPEHPSQHLFAGDDSLVCAGSSMNIQATGTTTKWQWSPATYLSCANCANPMATPTQTTTYVITGTDSFGCIAMDSITLTVQQRNPVTVGESIQLCVGTTATLSASGGDRYSWTPTTSLSCPDCPNPSVSDTVATNYQVLISQGNCFADTLHQKVIIAPNPTIQVGKDVLLFSGGQINLQTTTSANVKFVSWTPAVGLNCYTCRTPTVVDAKNTTTYVATVQTEYGCTASDSIRVSVACDGSPFYVANTFTPNNDGRDDWFYPQGTGIVRINRMVVQDRWGETVFERSGFSSNQPESGWDGSYKGQPLTSGTFMYLIEASCESGEQLLLKGDINLIR